MVFLRGFDDYKSQCVCVCMFVLDSSSIPKSLCSGEPKTRKSDSGFSALLNFFYRNQVES
jgi:hypothetical protein